MKNVILKWKLEEFDGGEQIISMPSGSQIIAVKEQYGHPCIWTVSPANRDCPTQERTFVVRLTGWEYTNSSSERYQHLDTVLLQNGTFVVHIFEVFK